VAVGYDPRFSKFFSAPLEGTGTRNIPRHLLMILPNIGSLRLELSTAPYTGFQGDDPPNPQSGP
jgi:hypothetical protein